MRWILKIVHNEHIALLWAVAVEILVHGFFGLQAFLLGGFLGEVALVKVFGPDLGQQIGAWSLGILIFGMAFVSFVLGEYLKAHVQSYIWAGKGGQEYMNALRETARMAIGLELSSLAFRVLTVGLREGDWPSAIVIAVAGCIGLRYAVMMAKVIHASVNRDVAYDLMRSQDGAAQRLAEQATKYTKNMSPDQLARWSEGDHTALQEVAGNGFFAEEQKRQAKEAKKTRRFEDKEEKRTRQLDEARKNQDAAESFRGAMQGARSFVSGFSRKSKDGPKDDPERSRRGTYITPGGDVAFMDALSNPGNHQSHNGSH